MKYCPSCQREFSDEVRLCEIDGTELAEETWQQFVANSLAADQSGSSSQRPPLLRVPSVSQIKQRQKDRHIASASGTGKAVRLSRVVFVALAIILVPVVLIIGYKWYFSLERRLDAAIAKGNLFSPPGSNAYELYQQLKPKASSGTVEKYDNKLFPLLTAHPQQLLVDSSQGDMKEPSLNEWDQAAKMLSWAGEIKPNDHLIQARAAYCMGRASYLKGEKDEAFKAWTKAADLDRAWAIPVNDLGLLSSERKLSKDARKYFSEAVRRDSKWAVPHNHIGTLSFYEGQYNRAIFHYKQSVTRDSKWARPHAWLATIAMQQKDYETAIKEFEKVLDPSATGTQALDLNKIREELARARKLLSSQAAIDTGEK